MKNKPTTLRLPTVGDSLANFVTFYKNCLLETHGLPGVGGELQNQAAIGASLGTVRRQGVAFWLTEGGTGVPQRRRR